MIYKHRVIAVVVSLPGVLAGCQGMDLSWLKPGPAASQPAAPDDETATAQAARDAARAGAALEGTVGAMSYVQGTRFMRVRGYGLVVGLNGRGSRYCPPEIRDEVIREVRRARSANPENKYQQSAEELLDSLDTAVVEVTGDVPAGAAAGEAFDVFVSATAVSPDTRSLAGGYLLPCDLKIFKEVSPAEIIAGRMHARARGPLFINPFGQAGAAAGTDPREGEVIGGGMNMIDRRLTLVTVVESYSTVRQMMDAINGRFHSEPKVADAVSPTNITLTFPPEWHGRESRFLDLVRHLPVTPSPMAREAKGKQLVGELARAGPPPEDAALWLEGLGPSILPLLQGLYAHPRGQVNYYAARTGLRLKDAPALEVIVRHAKDPRSPFRLSAISELGDCDLKARAASALRELLKDQDTGVRIRAYEALRKVDQSSIITAIIGRAPGNFLLDAVASDGPRLVYARKTKIRRIALVGADHLVLRPPLFYTDPGKQITLSAQAKDRFITVLRKAGGTVAGEFKVPPSVVLLTRFMGEDPEMGADGKPRGLGLDYAVVLDVLYHLCESGAIDASMKWEEQSVEDVLGPMKPMGRPESDL